tara:strand:+ start:1458 stop:1904 length:447 start_codon:yes stop_codon:yes gene_type:complete
MISVNVLTDNNLWKKKIAKPQIFFNKILKKFPKKYLFINKRVNFTLLLSQNSNIKKLNYKFRKKNKPTDVLSFPSFTKNELSKKLKKKEIFLGDIIISYQYIFPKKKDLLLESIFIHGFLHLLGHDHKKLQDFKIMNKEEKKILNSIN